MKDAMEGLLFILFCALALATITWAVGNLACGLPVVWWKALVVFLGVILGMKIMKGAIS